MFQKKTSYNKWQKIILGTNIARFFLIWLLTTLGWDHYSWKDTNLDVYQVFFLKVILLQRSIWEPEFYIVRLMFGFLKRLNKVIRPRIYYEMMNSKTILQRGSAQMRSRESEPKDIYPPKESSLKWANDYLRRIPKGVRVCTARLPLRKVPPPFKQWMMGCVSVYHLHKFNANSVQSNIKMYQSNCYDKRVYLTKLRIFENS